MLKDTYVLDKWAIASGKVATMAFLVIVLKLWSGAMSWVHNTNIWWFVTIFVVFTIMVGMNCKNCQCNVPKKVVKKKKR